MSPVEKTGPVTAPLLTGADFFWGSQADRKRGMDKAPLLTGTDFFLGSRADWKRGMDKGKSGWYRSRGLY
ncbi:hypothetical protein NDU88_002580 [Pleurodeles waltl]|uniref:Uncharacterized protein n=1 Tax=Pleurodeles waltl TaxID=8319 RepID=A0AAV7UW53_PLEWA|nr:hypothetical protein NDU88_002580 [Pleurodeles waltl]